MTRYCVIGAGAAGISALEQLRKAGYDVDCYEKTDRVGGHWHTDYDALHLITSRDMTHFEDFPMPADYPHFPRRDQVRAYLESYAEANRHYDVVRFNTRCPASPASSPASRFTPAPTAISATSTVTGSWSSAPVTRVATWPPTLPNIASRSTS
jgi:cation diffusion facilitator CzcD-associated flavoprotein CzcO